MKIERGCKTCGKVFTAIKGTQLFCCRACFRKDYNKREKPSPFANPMHKAAYNCQHCRNISMLDFNPLKRPDKISGHVCPFCGLRRDDETQETGVGSSYRMVISMYGAMTSTYYHKGCTVVRSEVIVTNKAL